jgi:hypothetical protein
MRITGPEGDGRSAARGGGGAAESRLLRSREKNSGSLGPARAVAAQESEA